MDCTNKNCPAYAKCLAPYRGSRCAATRATYGLGDPMTNADRLRSMSDEGIEDWYWWMHKEMMRYTDSRVFVHDWLKAPVEEVDE